MVSRNITQSGDCNSTHNSNTTGRRLQQSTQQQYHGMEAVTVGITTRITVIRGRGKYKGALGTRALPT